MDREIEEAAGRILESFEQKQTAILPILTLVQEKYGYINCAQVCEIATFLGIEPAEVDAIATFYDMVNRRPAGKYQLRLCVNVSCTMKGGRRLLRYLKNKLETDESNVSENGLFSVVPSQCLGACEMAPMMLVGDRYYENLNEEKLDTALEEIRIEDQGNEDE